MGILGRRRRLINQERKYTKNIREKIMEIIAYNVKSTLNLIDCDTKSDTPMYMNTKLSARKLAASKNCKNIHANLCKLMPTSFVSDCDCSDRLLYV